jgi:hypothetical protein
VVRWSRAGSANHQSEAEGRRGPAAGELGAWPDDEGGCLGIRCCQRLSCEPVVYTYERATVPLSDVRSIARIDGATDYISSSIPFLPPIPSIVSALLRPEQLPHAPFTMASLNTSSNGPNITRSYQNVVNTPPPSNAQASSPTYGQWAVFAVAAPLVSAFQGDGGKESVLKVQSTGGMSTLRPYHLRAHPQQQAPVC